MLCRIVFALLICLQFSGPLASGWPAFSARGTLASSARRVRRKATTRMRRPPPTDATAVSYASGSVALIRRVSLRARSLILRFRNRFGPSWRRLLHRHRSALSCASSARAAGLISLVVFGAQLRTALRVRCLGDVCFARSRDRRGLPSKLRCGTARGTGAAGDADSSEFLRREELIMRLSDKAVDRLLRRYNRTRTSCARQGRPPRRRRHCSERISEASRARKRVARGEYEKLSISHRFQCGERLVAKAKRPPRIFRRECRTGGDCRELVWRCNRSGRCDSALPDAERLVTIASMLLGEFRAQPPYGLSYPEIAEHLGVSLRTVNRNVSRAVDHLQLHAEPEIPSTNTESCRQRSRRSTSLSRQVAVAST